MRRSAGIAVVLAGLFLVLALWAVDNRPRPAQEEGLTFRQQEEALKKEETRLQELRLAFVVLLAFLLLLLALVFAGARPAVPRSLLVGVGLLLLFLVIRWFGLDAKDPSLLVLVALLAALAAGTVWVAPIDGFSLGAVFLAVTIEAILFLGWVLSPQGEPVQYFFTGSALPAILIGVTFLTQRLQRQT